MYCSGLQCPKIIWIDLNLPEKAVISDSDNTKSDIGTRVGKLAQEYYGKPSVVLFSSSEEMIAETNRLSITA